MPSKLNAKAVLRSLFDAAVASALPAHCLPPHLPAPDSVDGQLVVLGAGKAAARMASTVEKHWMGSVSGLVITPYGHAVPCRHIRVVQAAHPTPDVAGVDAARQMLALAKTLGPDDLALCLLSGGGSSLLTLPAAGLDLAQLQSINRALLRCGATIAEINIVRRHLSAIKGGRLAAACAPARVLNLMISDVPGDDASNIASGPSVPDPSTCQDAVRVADRYGIQLPAAALAALQAGTLESLKPGDPRLRDVQTRLVASPRLALQAAAAKACELGYEVHVLSDRLEGESREVGRVLAELARAVVDHGQPFTAPCILLSGGETTVTIKGKGMGGPNVECLLSMALQLDEHQAVHAVMADTDGVDGAAANAGAFITPDTLSRARRLGLQPREYLDRNDAHNFFMQLDDALVCGPSGTNVNDFRAILIDLPPSSGRS